MNHLDAPSSLTAPPSETSSSWAFPLHRTQWIQLLGALVAMTAVTVLVGWLLTDALAPNAITELDDDIAERIADARTPARTDLAHWGSRIADTEVKIVVTALLAAAAIALWRRWHEALLIVSALVLEATAFVVSSWIVGRERPDVTRLLDSPVESSFPSGHVAAATVYSVLVVIVFRHTRSTPARVSVVAVCAAAPVFVGWSRMYQGMHFLSDVVGGIVLGLASVVVCTLMIPPPPSDDPDSGQADPGDDASDLVATGASD